MQHLSVTCDRSVVYSRFTSPIKWPSIFSINIAESGVKYHDPNPVLNAHDMLYMFRDLLKSAGNDLNAQYMHYILQAIFGFFLIDL